MKQNADISKEMILCRYKQGIQLVKPSNSLMSKPEIFTLGKMLALPFSSYILDRQSLLISTNDYTPNQLGLSSRKELLNKSVGDFLDKQYVDPIHLVNNHIINSEHSILTEEKFFYKDEFCCYLSLKLPLYQNNTIVGIVGYSVLLNNYSVAEFIEKISSLNLLQATRYSENYRNLSRRETQVLRLMVRGKLSGDISKTLGLSQRTIQFYMENIKIKLNVSTRAELIEKVIEDFI